MCVSVLRSDARADGNGQGEGAHEQAEGRGGHEGTGGHIVSGTDVNTGGDVVTGRKSQPTGHVIGPTVCSAENPGGADGEPPGGPPEALESPPRRDRAEAETP